MPWSPRSPTPCDHAPFPISGRRPPCGRWSADLPPYVHGGVKRHQPGVIHPHSTLRPRPWPIPYPDERSPGEHLPVLGSLRPAGSHAGRWGSVSVGLIRSRPCPRGASTKPTDRGGGHAPFSADLIRDTDDRSGADRTGRVSRHTRGARKRPKELVGTSVRRVQRLQTSPQSLIVAGFLARLSCDLRTWFPGPSRGSLLEPVWRFYLPLRARPTVRRGLRPSQPPCPRTSPDRFESYPRSSEAMWTDCGYTRCPEVRHTWVV